MENKWTVLIGATVLSMDPDLGDFVGDVVVRDDRIVALVPEASREALGRGYPNVGHDVIDASGYIVMPGFVDSHRHMWEGLLRNIAPDAHLDDYFRDVLGKLAPAYTPKDVFDGGYVSCLGAINAGVTGILDWSHIQNTRSHTDMAIRALARSGMRAVFAYGTPMDGQNWWHKDSTLPHLRDEFEARAKSLEYWNEGGRLSLALAARGTDFSSRDTAIKDWRMARELGARISVHAGCGSSGGFHQKFRWFNDELLGPDVTVIHGTTLLARELDAIACSGTSMSLSVPVELMMGHGSVPIQECLNRTIPLSLSADVETTVPGDMFTQMRSFMAEQRRRVNEYELKATMMDDPNPKIFGTRLTAKEVLFIATQGGANANGWGDVCGSLRPGKKADLVVLNARSINVAPINDPYGAVVQGMDTSNVTDVMCDGKWLKRGGKLVGVDMDRVITNVEDARVALMERAGFKGQVK